VGFFFDRNGAADAIKIGKDAGWIIVDIKLPLLWRPVYDAALTDVLR